MGKERVFGRRSGARGHRQPQILAAAAGRGDHKAAGGGLEVGRPCGMAPDRARMQHLDRTDGSPHQVLFQPAADDLNLW
jgi:hypothetical protein